MYDYYDEAILALSRGHVLVGENHESPLGRSFVMMLLQSGSVKALMLESFRARSLVGGVNEDLARKGSNFMLARTQDAAGTFANPIKYESLVLRANDRDVRVFGFDLPGTWTDADNQERDPHMARLFTEAAQTYRTGIVMLVGSYHVDNLMGLFDPDDYVLPFKYS